MSESGASDWEAVDNETLAELEAEQAKYAAELEELRLAEGAAAGESSNGSTADLTAENNRLRAELNAMASVTASASRKCAEDEVKAKLAMLSAENARLTAALESGVGISDINVDITGVKPSTTVLTASRARMAIMVSSHNTHLLLYNLPHQQVIRMKNDSTGLADTCTLEAYVLFQGKEITDSALKASDMHSALLELTTREKGVDLCILMDGTGSMVSKWTLDQDDDT